MGLDTSHDAWHGPYSSFNTFRKWLAQKIGINLEDYIGYGEDSATKELTSIDHKLIPLFNHSDCDGILTPEECKQIAEGIEDAIKDEPEDLSGNEYSFSNLNKAKQFRKGCLLAYSLNENIDFH
jgi:ribosomal protein L32E